MFMRKQSVWQWNCPLHVDERVPYVKTVIRKEKKRKEKKKKKERKKKKTSVSWKTVYIGIFL